MSKLAQLRKSRGSNLKQLQKKLEDSKQQSGGTTRDDRIWKPKFNKEKGKGRCVVRFLPAKTGEPFAERSNYSFTGRGGNFYDVARRSDGLEDPVQIAAISAFRQAKATGDEALKKRAIGWLPKSRYFANVYIVKDEEVPENEGKVFVFEYGPAINSFIEKAINPEFDDVEPFDPFDLWAGADFTIRMVGKDIPDKKTGKKVTVPNYDESSFGQPSEFMGGDEEVLEQIFEQTYDLTEFSGTDKMKSFEDVAARFEKVTGHPYNWLDDGATEERSQKIDEDQEREEQQAPDPNVDKHRAKEEQEDSDDIPFGDTDKNPTKEDAPAPEDEDPVAKFRRLASQSKK